jgi:hypothetical protein
MRVTFGGAYKNYTIISKEEGIIQLMKNDTGFTKDWLRVRKGYYGGYDLTYAYRQHKQNKRLKSFVNKCFNRFKSQIFGRQFEDVDEFNEEFLLYISKQLRDFKLEDLLAE